jgi:integrase/recombinase XerD
VARRKPKAPSGCFWKGPYLYGEIQIKGQTYKKSLKTDDKGIAVQRREEWVKELKRDLYCDDGPRLFSDVLAEWLVDITGKIDGKKWHGEVSETTLLRYKVSLAQLAPFLENKKLSEITGKLIGAMVKTRKTEVTTATIKRDLVALSSVLNFAVLHQYCEYNPVLPWLKSLKERRDPICEPRDQDIELVIKRARGLWPYIIRAALVTGIRETALVNIQRSAVDHDRKEVSVIDKGNKFRVVDLKPMGGYDLFASIPAFVGGNNLFWRTEDKRVRRDSKREATTIGDKIEDPAACFRREVARVAVWAKENGVDFQPFCFHALRHKHAIKWLREGWGDIYDLQQRLGHSSIGQTEAYLKFLPPDQQRIAKHGKRAMG